MSDFLYCLTRAGSEPLLKQEVKEFHPSWHFAFSRPGFVTFKAPKPLQSCADLPYLRFARRRGISLGRGDLAQVLEFARALASSQTVQVYCREAMDVENPAAQAAGVEFQDRAKELLKLSRQGTGSEIIDVIETDPGKWMWGRSLPSEMEFRGPGGLSEIGEMDEAPSRAALKLEEALQSYHVKVEAEDSVLDLGCAPGGMSWVWLRRGARVTGVDRGDMAPLLRANSRFRHLETNLASVLPSEIPKRLDWVSLDVHAQPSIALREALPLFEEKSLLGFFVNLKIGRPGVVKDLRLFEREIAARLKLVRWCSKQLPSNKDEVAFFGVTQTGLKRGVFPTTPSPLMGEVIRSRPRS